MATLDANSYVLTNLGYLSVRNLRELADRMKDEPIDLQIYYAVIDGVLCKKSITPVFDKKVKLGLTAYHVYTEEDQVEGKVIYDLVTNGTEWVPPKAGDFVFRVRIIDGEPELYREEITDVEDFPVDNDYINYNEVVNFVNAPLGIVVGGYLVRRLD